MSICLRFFFLLGLTCDVPEVLFIRFDFIIYTYLLA